MHKTDLYMSSNNNKLSLVIEKVPKRFRGSYPTASHAKTDHSAESFTPSGCVCANTEIHG